MTDPVKTYEKNLKALSKVDHTLFKHLSTFTDNKQFHVIKQQGIVKIYDAVNDIYLQSDAEVDSAMSDYDKFQKYPSLFFFGIGSGRLVLNLLNKFSFDLIVIEPELELLVIALHFNDLSKFILSERCTIKLMKDFDFSTVITIIAKDKNKITSRIYELQTADPIYTTIFYEQMKDVNQEIVKTFEFVLTTAGNDVYDSILGLDYHTANLVNMLKSPPFVPNFVNKKNATTAVIVSMGPSLTKQLPLLYKIQNSVAIICADSALRVLARDNIKPDICVSLERLPLVAELFRDVSNEFKKGVIFLRASLQPDVIFEAVEDGTDVLVMRPFKYNQIFELDDYGYLCAATSVANMAHETAIFLGYEQCIFIGQDLAYGLDGSTHSKGHLLGESDESVGKATEKVLAYGGEGTVETNQVWKLFKHGLEQTVAFASPKMLSINSTEGGARIDGTLELPFAEAIEKYVDLSCHKEKIQITYPKKEDLKKLLVKTDTILHAIIKEGNRLQNILESAVLLIGPKCELLENKTLEEQLKALHQEEIVSLLDLIENVRKEMNRSHYFINFFYDLIQPSIVHPETVLTQITSTLPTSQQDHQVKTLKWILHHFSYFFSIAGFIDNIISILNKNSNKVTQEIKRLEAEKV